MLFVFIIHIKTEKGGDLTYLSDLVPFFKNNKLASMFFILLLFSLAGMPPTIGFYMKLLILKSLILSGYIKLTVVVLYANVISILYYIRIIKIIFFDAEQLNFYNFPKQNYLTRTRQGGFTLFENLHSYTNIQDIQKNKLDSWRLGILTVRHIF